MRLGTDAVAVSGGDGTVALALQVLAHTGTPLGIIPAGTGNDLAEMLGLRELHPDEAADAIAGGRTRDIDLARIRRDGHPPVYFGSVLASGFDSPSTIGRIRCGGHGDHRDTPSRSCASS